jgi:hypothetical protein
MCLHTLLMRTGFEPGYGALHPKAVFGSTQSSTLRGIEGAKKINGFDRRQRVGRKMLAA